MSAFVGNFFSCSLLPELFASEPVKTENFKLKKSIREGNAKNSFRLFFWGWQAWINNFGINGCQNKYLVIPHDGRSVTLSFKGYFPANIVLFTPRDRR